MLQQFSPGTSDVGLGQELGEGEQTAEFREELGQMVVEVMTLLEQAEGPATIATQDLDPERHAVLLADLEARYTMESQRNVHRAALQQGVEPLSGDDDNVELF